MVFDGLDEVVVCGWLGGNVVVVVGSAWKSVADGVVWDALACRGGGGWWGAAGGGARLRGAKEVQCSVSATM